MIEMTNNLLLIDLVSTRLMLERDFFHTTIDEFIFLPETLCQIAVEVKANVTIENIQEWELFEYGKVDFSNEHFVSLLFNDRIHSLQSEIILISDESLAEKVAFQFKLSDFEDFASYYEQKYQMAFFQPADYIVINTAEKNIKIIHHEGKLITISL